MNKESCKIELADLKLLVEWSGNRLFAVDSNASEEDRYNDTHTHPMFEVFFVSEGTLTVITHKSKIECRNSIVVIPPYLPHCTLSKHTRVSVMYFRLEQAQKSHDIKLFSPLSERLSKDITILDINDGRALYVQKIWELQNDNFFADERLDRLTYLLFTDIISELAPPPVPTSGEKHRNYLKTIQDHLTYHYNEKVLITDLAELLYLSPKQVSRIIRKEYNCSFSEMLTAHRLNVARMLLLRSDIDVNKIAALVGYEYPANFFKHFKKAYGITPAEYRKNKKQS
jgi:AraC-like DNA-binding protein